MMRWLRTAFAILFAAAVLYCLQRTRPLYSRITSPIVASGGMNEPVKASAFAVLLTKVRVARELKVVSFGSMKSFTSSGVWVMVEGGAVSRHETLALTSGEWLSRDGIRYALTDRLPANVDLMPADTLQPGLPRPILLVFEVPETAVAGGSVVFSRTKLFPLSDEIRIATGASTGKMESAITLGR